MYTELQSNVDWIPDSDEVFKVMLLLEATEEEVCVPDGCVPGALFDEGCVPDTELLLGPLLLGSAAVDPEVGVLLGTLEECALPE